MIPKLKYVPIWARSVSTKKGSQMLFRISVLKKFANSTGKHLCWRQSCNPKGSIKKRIQHRCDICKIIEDNFFYRTVPVPASDVQLVFWKESRRKTSATVRDKCQIQLKKRTSVREIIYEFLFSFILVS